MIRLRRIFAVTVLMSMALLNAAGAQDGGPVTDANLAQRVESAKTAADHQALATYFNSQAAAAAAKVKEHREMLAAFKKSGGRPAQVWDPHCQVLIKSYTDAQQSYLALAQEQEGLAKQAGK